MNVLSLFSGIGGLDLGLERAGITVVGQVEIDPWCRKILAKHWPEVPRHDDVRTAADWWLTPHVADTVSPGLAQRQGQPGDNDPQLAATERSCRDGATTASNGGRPAVDLVCGGFPCQPVSSAGRRLAQNDPRWLWPAMAQVIRRLQPAYVLVENVPGLLARGMGDVLGDLAACGYDAEWDCVPASAVGAPHRRDRVWIVAYPNRDVAHANGVPANGGTSTMETRRPVVAAKPRDAQPNRDRSPMADANGAAGPPARTTGQTVFRPGPIERPGRRDSSYRDHWAAEPDVGRVAHGIPARVDRLRGLGNAVVPQVAERIGRLIMEAAA